MATALEVYQDFLLAKELEGVSPTTIQRYEFSIKRMLLEVDIDDIQDISTTDIRRWLAGREVKSVTKGIDVKNLRTFFKWAASERYRADNPMDRIPTPKVAQRPPKVLDEDEMRRLIQAAKQSPRDLAIVLVLVDCGLRASELGALERDDLDFDGLSLLVRNGKGGKPRTAFFSPTTARAVRRYLRTRKDTDPALFLSQRSEPVNRDSLRLLLYRLSDRAGLNNGRRVSPHVLRATFATRFASNGGGAHILQRLMGHSNVATSERYVSLAGRDLAAAHRRYSPVARLERQRRA